MRGAQFYYFFSHEIERALAGNYVVGVYANCGSLLVCLCVFLQLLEIGTNILRAKGIFFSSLFSSLTLNHSVLPSTFVDCRATKKRYTSRYLFWRCTLPCWEYNNAIVARRRYNITTSVWSLLLFPELLGSAKTTVKHADMLLASMIYSWYMNSWRWSYYYLHFSLFH